MDTLIFAIILVIVILIIACFLLSPAYLILFLRHRKKAKAIDPELMPSKWSPIMYACILVYLLFFIWASFTIFLKSNKRPSQSEAKVNLGAIFVTQVAYFSETNIYAGGKDAFELLDWAPEGENKYAFYAGDDVIPNVRGDEITYRPDGDWPFKQRPESTQTAFTVMAVGNIDDDDFPDVWLINDGKFLRNPLNDHDNSGECPGCFDLDSMKLFSKTKYVFVQTLKEIMEFIMPILLIAFPVILLMTLINIYYDLKKYSRLKAKAAEADGEEQA